MDGLDSEELVIDVEESRSVPEGMHTGRIANLSTRDSPFGTYLDLDIDILDIEEGEEDGMDVSVITTLTAGFPLKVTEESWLGELLEKFGARIGEPGESISIPDFLLHEACQFETQDETTEDGTFAEIQKQTIRPHPKLSKEDVWPVSFE